MKWLLRCSPRLKEEDQICVNITAHQAAEKEATGNPPPKKKYIKNIKTVW